MGHEVRLGRDKRVSARAHQCALQKLHPSIGLFLQWEGKNDFFEAVALKKYSLSLLLNFEVCFPQYSVSLVFAGRIIPVKY